jgi:hypothetical protein
MRRLLFIVAVTLAPLPAVAQLNAGGKKIVNLAPGVAGTDAATVSQISGSAITALTGPVTATGPGSVASSITDSAVTLPKLANVGANTILGNNTGGSAPVLALTTTQVKSILAISASTDVSGLASVATTGSAASLSTGTLAAARLPAFTGGDVTASAGNVDLTLIASGVSAATYGSATQVAVCTFNAKGLATSCSSTTISVPATAISDSTAVGRTLLTAANAGAQRTALALVPGTDVQTQDAELQALAGVTSASDALPYFTGSGTATTTTLTSTARGLLDDGSQSAMRTTIGVGTISTQDANNVSITGGSITGMSSPSGTSDVATKGYVDSVASSIQNKAQARVATAAAGTLATSFENGDTVDGVVLATGDRIVIKDQASQTENGIYTVNASGAPTRATDADSGSELVGATVQAAAGTANAGKVFTQTTPATITIGATNIVFVNFLSLGGALIATNNLSDLSNAGTARTNLGLGTLATQSGTFSGTSSGTNTGDQTITLTGDVTGSGSGSFAATIGANRVTRAMEAAGAALSVIGRSANSSGNVADIAASAASGGVLRESGSTIGFGTIATAGIGDSQVTLAKIANQATATILGNNTGGSAAPLALTAAQVRTLLGMPTLTTKGDLYTFSTVEARLAVGSDGLCLKALASNPTGLEWGTCAAGGSGLTHAEVMNRAVVGF